MQAAETFLINTSLLSNFFCLFLPHPNGWSPASTKFGVRVMIIVQPKHHEEDTKRALVRIQRTTGLSHVTENWASSKRPFALQNYIPSHSVAYLEPPPNFTIFFNRRVRNLPAHSCTSVLHVHTSKEIHLLRM